MKPPPAASANRDRDLLITEHMPMARRIARKVLRRMPDNVHEDDLVSAAVVGLIEAAERFDRTRSEPFVAFAAPRIRGAVLDELRRGDVMPRRVRSAANKVGEAIATLEQRLGRSPEDTEVAQALGVPIKTYRAKLADLTSVRLVELPVSGGAWEVADGGASPVADLERTQLTARVRAALDEIAERDALVLSLYYVEELSYIEIGEILGVSESRICQLHARAIRRLRDLLAE